MLSYWVELWWLHTRTHYSYCDKLWLLFGYANCLTSYLRNWNLTSCNAVYAGVPKYCIIPAERLLQKTGNCRVSIDAYLVLVCMKLRQHAFLMSTFVLSKKKGCARSPRERTASKFKSYPLLSSAPLFVAGHDSLRSQGFIYWSKPSTLPSGNPWCPHRAKMEESQSY